MLKRIAPCCTIGCNVLALGLIVFSFFIGRIVNNAVSGIAAQNVVLKPSTYNTWGVLPGSTGTFISLSFSFFNFTNPGGFAYFNQSAKLVETRSFDYQEFQNYLEPNYTNNSQGIPVEVTYYQQRYTRRLNTTVDYEQRNVLNAAHMGVWYNAKNIPDENVGMSGFALMQSGFAKSLYPSILAKGISGSQLKDKASCDQKILNKVLPELSPEQKNAIWSDTLYGMGAGETLSMWILAATEGPSSGAANILKDYFQLSIAQLSMIVGKPLTSWMANLNDVIANWYNCSTTPCDPMYLGALQWSQQGVTLNPPGASNSSNSSTPSIASSNRTTSGYPEISYFLKEYLLKSNFTEKKSAYENITFTTNFGLQVLNSTPTPPYAFPATNQTLLNIKNYKFILDIGDQFEKKGGTPEKLQDLEPIRTRWNLSTLQHAYVFYRYAKYFVREFALKESSGGSRGFTALGKFASQALYEKFDSLKSFLFVDLLSRDIQISIQDDRLNCVDLLNNSFGGEIAENRLRLICAIPQLFAFDLESVKFLVSVCRYEQQYSYQNFKKVGNLTNQNLMSLCQHTDPQTFGKYFVSSQAGLNQHYGCTSSSSTCSDFEFAAKQWGASNITMHLPPRLQPQFPQSPSLSVSTLYPELYRVPFEYLPVLKYLSPNYPEMTITGLNYTQTLNYLNFSSLFSATMISKAFLLNKTNDLDSFQRIYGFSNPIPLLSYFRYLVIENFFDGLSIQRTGSELLMGYRDRVIDKISKSDILNGGNPSVNPVVSYSTQNSTVEDARKYLMTVYTGGDNSSKVKVFKEIQRSSIITCPYTYFDGLEVRQENRNPWREEVSLAGNGLSISKPNQKDGENVTFFVPDMYFSSQLTLSNFTKQKINGVEAHKITLPNSTLANKTNNPNNAKYYSERWNSALNLTKVRNVPVFLTKQYFLDADWEIVTAAELYKDEGQTQRIWPKREFDLTFYIEPTTGSPLKADQRMQMNVYFEADELFPNMRPTFVPLMYFYRGMELPANTTDTLFRPLKLGFAVRDYGVYIFLALGVVFLLIGARCYAITQRAKKVVGDLEEPDHERALIANDSVIGNNL